MTTYNTGNPIGSTDPKDLYDNAQNLDVLVNSATEVSHADRKGVQRKTWRGMEAQFDQAQSDRADEFAQFMADSAYQDLGVYGAGIEVTRYNQVFLKDGEFYRAAASLVLPYTTTGVWVGESASFVAVGDAVLRQDLATLGGSALVEFDGGTAQDVLDESKPIANYTALRNYAGRATGVRITQTGLAGFFQRDDADTTSADNGGTVIVDGTWRRWKRLFSGAMNVRWFGAKGNAVTDDTAAMNAAAAAAGTAKTALFVPSGVYKMTAPWMVPIQVRVVGESPMIQTVYDPGAAWAYGSIIFKAHTGNAIEKIGPSAYASGAPIENITVSSHRTTYAGGAGFVLDQCSNVHLIRCNVFGVGGDAFVLGVTAGDVTGHNYVYNCYSNNPAGKHYSIRQKWGRYRDIVCDGGTWGAYLTDAPDSDMTGFHFEGFTVGAIKLAGANTSTRIYHGFVGNTAGATKGIEADAVPGNHSFLFSAIKMQGSSVAGSKAIALAANSVDSIVVGCEFNQWATGVENLAWYANTQTIIRDNEFVGCGACIVSNAQNTVYQGNSFNDTTGAYDINHLGGSLGLWSGNTFSKGINPGVTGVAGNFSGVRVKDNAGYITRKRGVTAASPAYTNIAHGLAGVPDMPIGLSCLSSGVTSVPQIALRNVTNFQLYWTGTANVQWAWEAALPCDY